MTGPLDILAQLDQIRAETLKRLEPLTQEQLDWKPPSNRDGEEAWSLGEIFLHLALDEHYLREQIARPLLEGVKPPDGVFFIPPPPSYGMKKDVIQFWFERARIITRCYLENLPADIHLELKHEGGLQLMNGLEWFQGYGGHEAFHHKQIDTVIVQLSELLHS
jgi:DinB family protein